MPNLTGQAFQTFQTVARYESALARHGQWMRWMRGMTCPCIRSTTGQADPHCGLCKGRGRIYRTPGDMHVLGEAGSMDAQGKVRVAYKPVTGGITGYHQGTALTLGTQPADGSYIQFAPPFLRPWMRVIFNYSFSSDVSVVDENSDVVAANVLRTVATRFSDKGKTFEGSIRSVSRVYNVTRSLTYVVTAAHKEFIYLSAMASWVPGDVLEVDYVYVRPFSFILVGVTQKIQWQQPYVMEDADAILMTPYWAKVGPDDLVTMMAGESIGRCVVDPGLTVGNDELRGYHDVSSLMHVISLAGAEYTVGPGKNVELAERNELRWNVAKPAVQYVVMFTYHPTFVGLSQMGMVRNAENKAFINRISVKQFDRPSEEMEF